MNPLNLAARWCIANGINGASDSMMESLYSAYCERRNLRTLELYARLEPWGA